LAAKSVRPAGGELESAMDRCGAENEIDRSEAIRRLVEIALKTAPARAKR
jgi:hypothetical protein